MGLAVRGKTVEDYEIWGQLSHGGMSDVWLARQRELAIPVIIKTLHPLPGEPAAERFRRLLTEARLMARVGSPRVVRVLDVGRDPGHELPFLVEEYVDGIDLAELDTRRREVLGRPLSVSAVAATIAQAAKGLHAAHQAGVVHCDVKPGNLFGDAKGRVKVGDFGVANTSAGEHHGSSGGTPGFMAPEQLAGARLDRRTDVFALGATAYALRYGASPFVADGRLLPPDPQVSFPPARSPDEAYFQHLVARMLHPSPEARPSSMAVVARRFADLARPTRPRAAAAEASFVLGNTRIAFEVGDISEVETDAVVNSANSALEMTGGVGSALRTRGGESIEREAMARGERALGECVHTAAGRLPCRGVLHAVGGWNEVSCVARATFRALFLAEQYGYRRIALPAIGTGQGRVSLESSADAMVSALVQHLELGGSRLAEVRFVLADREAHRRCFDVAREILLDTDLDALDPDVDVERARVEESESAPTVFASSAVGLAS